MSIARVQSDVDTGTSTAPTATLAAPPGEGSLLVCAVRYDSSTGTIAARSGWMKLSEVLSSRRTCLLYRIAGPAEPGLLQPCDFSASASWSCIGVEYAGVWRANPLDVEGAQADNDALKTSPAVDPVDAVERLGVGFAMSNSAASWSGRTIGGLAANNVVSGSLVNLFDLVFTSVAGAIAAEVTASVAANGSAHLALFRGQPVQAVHATATGAATAGKAAARMLLLGLVASAGQARAVGKAVAAAVGASTLAARSVGRALTVAATAVTAAGRSLVGLSGAPLCVFRAVARGLVVAARRRETTGRAQARGLTFVARDPC